MRVVVGTDHAGLPLKAAVIDELRQMGVDVLDVGTHGPERVDFPDYAELAGRAIQQGEAERGVLLCGSGVGVCIAANKLRGIRASVAHDIHSAHQGVEHDGMNVLCLGSRVVGEAVARELVRSFIHARFEGEDRFVRRIAKISALEDAG